MVYYPANTLRDIENLKQKKHRFLKGFAHNQWIDIGDELKWIV